MPTTVQRLIIITALTIVARAALAEPAASGFDETALNEPTLAALWEVVERQQAQIEALEKRLADASNEISVANERLDETEEQLVATGAYVEALPVDEGRRDTQIGGYGELHLNDLSADDSANDAESVDFHRFVLFFGHRFNDRARFFSELELEHSITGDGAPGEAELEQAYVDFTFNGNLAAQAGLFLVPVGLLNETHEPPTFFGVERNDVESVIIPGTWWEGGAALRGTLASGLSWDLAVHSGLAIPTTGPSAFRIRSGRQKVAEAPASDPALTMRLRYAGIRGLEVAASYQYQTDPSQIAGDGLDSGRLFTAHAVYRTGDFTLRGLYGAWSFDGAAVELAGDDRQTGWYLEPSYRINSRWGIYARYEDVDGARDIDEFTQAEAGFNYWPVPDVVVKLDYRERVHALGALAGEDFDSVDLGIGYQF